MQKIEFGENKIERLESTTFESFSSAKGLEELNLASNFLKELPEKPFQSFRTLFTLTLSQNQISHIHASAFVGMEGEWFVSILIDPAIQGVTNLFIRKTIQRFETDKQKLALLGLVDQRQRDAAYLICLFH